jgi:hypothetical protein
LVGHPRNGSVQAVGQTREEEHPERVVIVFIDQESDEDGDKEDAEDGQAVWNVHDAAGRSRLISSVRIVRMDRDRSGD